MEAGNLPRDEALFSLISNKHYFMQVLDQDLDLRTVKYSIWKSSGDIRLYYREVDPLPKAAADDNGETTKAGNSEEGKDEKQGGESQEQDNTTSEEAHQAEGDSGEGEREQEMETEGGGEEQLVAVMDGEEEEEEEADSEKMEDSRTEEKS